MCYLCPKRILPVVGDDEAVSRPTNCNQKNRWIRLTKSNLQVQVLLPINGTWYQVQQVLAKIAETKTSLVGATSYVVSSNLLPFMMHMKGKGAWAEWNVLAAQFLFGVDSSSFPCWPSKNNNKQQ